MINVFQPQMGQEECDAVSDVLKSNWIGRGSKTEDFEKNFSEYIKVTNDNVYTTTSCTEALFQSLTLIDIKEGDEVILPSISFTATANAIMDKKAIPVFCDVDIKSLNTSWEYIKDKITSKTKAVVLIHYGGVSCDIDPIINGLKEKNIYLIEDSACSLGTLYKGKHCGTLSDIATWSFDPAKLVSCGSGGMLYAKNKNHIQKFKENIYLGLRQQSGFNNKGNPKWWEFDVHSNGRNATMNDISASIALEQLKKIDKFIDKRKHVGDIFNKEFESMKSVKVNTIPDYCKPNNYFYWIQLENEEMRNNLALHLRQSDIYTTYRYYPLHLIPHYGSNNIELKNTMIASQTTLCLPNHQSLSGNDIDKILETIKCFIF